ncbi:MAG: hypothetical protein NXI20_28630 [bacterium]|nr:hypothetical protein [bacterium]
MKLLKLAEKILKRLLIPRYNSKTIARTFMQQFNKVVAGPFKGLKYTDESIGSKLYPKILGTYEQELHSTVQEIVESKYEKVINVGAAEGYYAIGFASVMPKISVTAFETSSSGQKLIKSLAELNGVTSRLEIKGECTPKNMQEFLTAKSCIVMDVEGAEKLLLNPQNCKPLLKADILVEVHEHLVSGIQSQLRSWFNRTHEIQEIQSRKRSSSDFKFDLHLTWDQRFVNSITFGNFNRKIINRLINEYRKAPVKWFFMRQKSN